jgi:haloalkane dehalogenase
MDLRQPKKNVRVLGHTMAYVERGEGAPVVFLHGNPTSSFLWRNVIAPLSARCRCLAPDLIGMGDSDKLAPSGPDAYSFFRHREFLDGFLDAMRFDRPVVLVVHDWGSALGFDWARRNPDRVRGIAYMEAIVGPLTWEGWPPAARGLFEALRSPEGERMILEQNVFVEQILPGGVLRGLSADELAEYQRPFREPGEARRPTLSWPRAIPIDGQPADVNAVAERYAAWLAEAPIPKLFVNAEPGAVLVGSRRDACRRWPNQREVTVRGHHFVQEDSAPEIAAALGDWLAALP